MSLPTNAQDFLDAITDVMEDLGTTRSVRVRSYGSLNPSNPGAGKPQTTTDYSVDAILYDYDDRYFGSSGGRQTQDRFVDITPIQRGDRVAVVSVEGLDSAVIAAMRPSSKLIDGSDIYAIINTRPIEVAGETITVFMQIRK